MTGTRASVQPRPLCSETNSDRRRICGGCSSLPWRLPLKRGDRASDVSLGHRFNNVDVGAGNAGHGCALTVALGFVLQVDDVPERALVNALRLLHSLDLDARFVDENPGLLDDRRNRILE